MTRVKFVIGTLVMCALTALSGWLHITVLGAQRVTERMQTVGQRLAKFPTMAIGDWTYVSSDELRESAVKMLETPAYLQRTYIHEKRGWQVQVFVAVGPHGPISVHTPDVCYPANDYVIPQKGKIVSLTDADGKEHELWGMNLRSRDSDGQRLRSLHGWSRDGTWKAPKHPRFAFVGAPYLYKIQLASPVAPDDEDNEQRPGDEFLKVFLPALREYMVL